MTTMARRPDHLHSSDTEIESSGHRRGPVVVAVVVAALLGFGLGWLVFGSDSSDSSDVPADVQALYDEWTAAWNDADGETALSLMDQGALHYCPMSGPTGIGGDEFVQFVGLGWPTTDAEIVSVTSPLGRDDPTVPTASTYVVVTEFTLDGEPGWMSVLYVGDENGELRIYEHRVFG